MSEPLKKYWSKRSDWSYCPACGGGIDTGYECNKCGRDWLEFHETRQELLDKCSARERAVWLEAAKYWDNNPPYSKLELVFPSDAYPKWGNVFAAWCRQRAEAVKP